MIGDVIYTFRKTATGVNRTFVQKSRKETSIYQSVLYSKTWFASHVLLGNAILQPIAQETFIVNNTKMNNLSHTPSDTQKIDMSNIPFSDAVAHFFILIYKNLAGFRTGKRTSIYQKSQKRMFSTSCTPWLVSSNDVKNACCQQGRKNGHRPISIHNLPSIQSEHVKTTDKCHTYLRERF